MRRLSIILLAFLLSSSLLFAQGEKEKDFEAWLSARVSKDFDKDVDIAFEVQTRLFEYSQTFAEIAVEYKLLDFINIGTEIRLKFLNGGTTEYRIAPLISIEGGKKDVEISFQFKYQADLSRFDEPESTFRNKLTAKYKINKKWRLSTSMELFLGEKDEIFWAEKFRWSLATRHKFSKHHYLTWFYSIDRNNKFDEDDDILQKHIAGVKYDLKW